MEMLIGGSLGQSTLKVQGRQSELERDALHMNQALAPIPASLLVETSAAA
jgi:hypothetical protein